MYRRDGLVQSLRKSLTNWKQLRKTEKPEQNWEKLRKSEKFSSFWDQIETSVPFGTKSRIQDLFGPHAYGTHVYLVSVCFSFKRLYPFSETLYKMHGERKNYIKGIIFQTFRFLFGLRLQHYKGKCLRSKCT